jgi:YceI-like domain
MTTSSLSRNGIPTGTWKIDKAHTRVGFAVKHLGVATVRGEFREFDGALEIGEDLADSRAYGHVDAASVDTGLAPRDGHLRTTDFRLVGRRMEGPRGLHQLRCAVVETIGRVHADHRRREFRYRRCG